MNVSKYNKPEPEPLDCCDDMTTFYANKEIVYSHDYGFSMITANQKDYVPILYCPWCGKAVQDTVQAQLRRRKK